MKRMSPVAWDLVGCGALLLFLVVPTCLAMIRSLGDWRVFLSPEVLGYIAFATFLVFVGIYGRRWRRARSG